MELVPWLTRLSQKNQLPTCRKSTKVTALEQFLIDFSDRRQLSENGTLCLLQAVTTQMSQLGGSSLCRGAEARTRKDTWT